MTNEEKNARFLALYCMILADGVIDARELETLYKIGIESYELTPEQISICVKSTGNSFNLPDKQEEKIQLMYELAQIAWADGILEESEVDLLKTYAQKMGFDEGNIDQIVDYLLNKAKEKVPFVNVLNEILMSK
ncbi:MAG: TerB family tellurite resistance protein [Paramuribaculum sp.]|nr:TerB family tellurite resistance protein [Paramuribaculum sp.]